VKKRKVIWFFIHVNCMFLSIKPSNWAPYLEHTHCALENFFLKNVKECLDQRFSLWDFGPWTPSKVTLRLVELLLEQLDNSTSLLPPTLKKMWMQFHSSSSTTLATKCECGGSVLILQLLWPQSVNAVVPFQFFNYILWPGSQTW
jgi:hypothetical protein